MTPGLSAVGNTAAMPTVNRDDVVVTLDPRDRLKVTEWTAAIGDRAELDLFILIDDASTTQLGSQLGSLHAERNCGIDLMNRWTTHHDRRVGVMVTDGIDRARGGPRQRGIGPTADSCKLRAISGCCTAVTNPYLRQFRAVPGRRAGAQSVSVSTQVLGVEICQPRAFGSRRPANNR